MFTSLKIRLFFKGFRLFWSASCFPPLVCKRANTSYLSHEMNILNPRSSHCRAEWFESPLGQQEKCANVSLGWVCYLCVKEKTPPRSLCLCLQRKKFREYFSCFLTYHTPFVLYMHPSSSSLFLALSIIPFFHHLYLRLST